MVYIKSILARHELVVANYYIKRKAYTAAINRAKTVIENYPKTEAVSDALAIFDILLSQNRNCRACR